MMSTRRARTGWNLGEGFVLRCPSLPFDRFASEEPLDVEARRQWLCTRLEDPVVLEAITLASPSLATELEAWKTDPTAPRGQGVERSLIRYLSRMSGRATPFGLFSGVAVGRWGQDNALRLPPVSKWQRTTRIDGAQIEALCDALELDPAIAPRLAARANASLYRHHDGLRYARRDADGEHSLVDLEPSTYLLRTLERARSGATEAELVAGLRKDVPEVDDDDARQFIAELRNADLLVSPLCPPVTGHPPLEAIVDSLAGHDAPRVHDLRALREAMRVHDLRGPGRSQEDYDDLRARLQEIAPQLDATRSFAVDLSMNSAGQLGPRVQAKLREGIDLIERLDPGEDNESLRRFREAFVEHYGQAEVPLMEALDEDSGVGFQDPGSIGEGTVPLLAGLRFPSAQAAPTVPLQPRDRHLLRLYERAIGDGVQEVVLSDDDVEALTVERRTPLPDALCTIATLAAASPQALADGDFRVLVEWADGPSGAKLLGRFCHVSEEVETLVREHIKAEQALHPDVAFAEVVHREAGRAANVMARPVLRDYEIAFGGTSGAPSAAQISVDDLMVSVVDEQIVLRSRGLDRRVVPRVTSAHNFRERGLSPYRFLCALQNQNAQGGGFGWGVLRSAPFLPRVRRGDVVLTRARWLLDARDLAPLKKASASGTRAKTTADVNALRDRIVAAIQKLCARLRLPRWVVLVDGDNELPIDLDDALCVEAFVHGVRNRNQVVLRELFGGPGGCVVQGSEGLHAHQLMCTFVRERDPEPSSLRSATSVASAAPVAPRRFPPGGPWLYLKFYAGTGVADRVLCDAVGPAVAQARADGLADRWFFMRYRDPQPHLRVRFHGDPTALWGELLPRLHDTFAPLLATGRLRSVQLDTYVPELERYGGASNIEAAERIFEADSDAVVGVLSSLAGEPEAADARWRLALVGADRLLVDLGFSLPSRRTIVTQLADSFAEEHDADTPFAKQLAQIFRREREGLVELLRTRDVDHPLAPALAILDARGAAITEIAAAAPFVSPAIAASLVHMHCNRMLGTHQRAQETVIYDLLRRSYATVAALEKRAAGPVRARAGDEQEMRVGSTTSLSTLGR